MAHSPRPPPWPRNINKIKRVVLLSVYFWTTDFVTPIGIHNQMLPMTRSAEQRARRAEKERAKGAPCCRVDCLSSGWLALDKAATRRRRQALESSITTANSRMRAELRRQAAVVAAARCARRDTTRNDTFEHLLWRHSCSGSLGVMNDRRLSHLKNAGVSAALAIARQATYSRIYRSTFLCQLST